VFDIQQVLAADTKCFIFNVRRLKKLSVSHTYTHTHSRASIKCPRRDRFLLWSCNFQFVDRCVGPILDICTALHDAVVDNPSEYSLTASDHMNSLNMAVQTMYGFVLNVDQDLCAKRPADWLFIIGACAERSSGDLHRVTGVRRTARSGFRVILNRRTTAYSVFTADLYSRLHIIHSLVNIQRAVPSPHLPLVPYTITGSTAPGCKVLKLTAAYSVLWFVLFNRNKATTHADVYATHQ
jgi:hypothetical protein